MVQARSILAVIDPTADEQPALERAQRLARKLPAAVELFICDYDQYLAGERFFDSTSLDTARRDVIDAHRKRLEAMAEHIAESGLEVSIDAAWDHPLHEGIVRKVLRSKPAYVVKDTHYHTAIRRSIFSNTDWSLIRDCPAPLFLVKPRPFGDPPTIVASVDPVHERDKPAELDHRILQESAELRVALEADLHVFHAFDPSPAYAVSADSMVYPVAAPMTEMMEALQRKHEQAVRGLMESYPDVPADKIHILQGDVREVLGTLIDDVRADLVVMGAVSRRALQRLVLGSTAERVLDHIPCDLLVLKPADFQTPVPPS